MKATVTNHPTTTSTTVTNHPTTTSTTVTNPPTATSTTVTNPPTATSTTVTNPPTATSTTVTNPPTATSTTVTNPPTTASTTITNPPTTPSTTVTNHPTTTSTTVANPPTTASTTVTNPPTTTSTTVTNHPTTTSTTVANPPTTASTTVTNPPTTTSTTVTLKAMPVTTVTPSTVKNIPLSTTNQGEIGCKVQCTFNGGNDCPSSFFDPSSCDNTDDKYWAKIIGKQAKYSGMKIANSLELEACDKMINNECNSRMAAGQPYGMFTMTTYIYQNILTISDVILTCISSINCHSVITTEPMTMKPSTVADTSAALSENTSNKPTTPSATEVVVVTTIAPAKTTAPVKVIPYVERSKMKCELGCEHIHDEGNFKQGTCPPEVVKSWSYCAYANDKYWGHLFGSNPIYHGRALTINNVHIEGCDTAMSKECTRWMAPGQVYGVFQVTPYTYQQVLHFKNATFTCIAASECPAKLCKITCRSNVERSCPANFSDPYCINLTNWCAKRWSSECQANQTATKSEMGTTVIYSYTETNRQCQNWSSQTPHNHVFGYVGDHNHCHNPDGKAAPWCYTSCTLVLP